MTYGTYARADTIRLGALFALLSSAVRITSSAGIVSGLSGARLRQAYGAAGTRSTRAFSPRYPADVPAARDPWFRRDSAK